ncbi:flagellar hook-length control protein FliK [Rhodanobacter thiooxydans]|uniref:flagellar hook-length control protein FliK n=1 Tax=Rhodanobacter thiooxydans TaxID=416169 RepID=UPI00131F3FDA|nr:flagellar hook-length control protein FliK [Rhodanobacter thiooxydans]
MSAPVTATATGPVATAGPRSTTAGELRDSAGNGAANEFDSQLHVARQQHDARNTDDAPGNQDDGKRMPATSPSTDRQPATARPADPGTSPALPPATPVSVPAAGTVAPTTTAPADRNESDGQPAPAVAAAMLALLGSSVAAALQPATGHAGVGAGSSGSAGKAVAGGVGTVTMFQLDSVGSPGAAPAGTLPLAASLPAMAAAALPASAAADKDSAEGRGLLMAMALPAPPAATTAPAAPHQLQLPASPGSPSFAQDLGQQVAWLGGQSIKQARIRLHPEELGSLDVSVSVNHGRVDVVFSAQHAAAIPAVQQSLPQLDQMLARHGLSLGHAEVGQHDRGDRRGHAEGGGTAALDEITDVHGGMPSTLGKVGLLDAFA